MTDLSFIRELAEFHSVHHNKILSKDAIILSTFGIIRANKGLQSVKESLWQTIFLK